MENENSSNANQAKNFLSIKNLVLSFSIILIILVAISAMSGYYIGKNSSNQKVNDEKVLSSNFVQITNPPTSTPSPEPTPYVISVISQNPKPIVDSKVCSKYGFAQKWEYLTSYTIKENDNINNIAKNELGDETRVNEILKINGVGPLVVGSTLYLPPASIPKSSGNLKQIYGKISDKNSSSWHVLLTQDSKGQGILIPTFLFQKVANKDSFKISDCVKVFLDDGYEVYTIALQ